MREYVHGGDIYSALEHHETVLDFSANINPLGIPNGVVKAIADAAKDCAAYPDPFCRELIHAFAKSQNINPAYVLMGNGAADVIFRLVQAVRPKKALVLAPTFAEYEKALHTVGCQVLLYPLKEEQDFLLGEDFLDCLDESLDMIFICNPNNPTGQLTEKPLLLRILERCKALSILLVLDECFSDFLDDEEHYTMKGYLSAYSNLFVLGAFTKIYAMAGVRLGYGLCANQVLLDKIWSCSQAWSVSTLAQKAGLAALLEQDYRQKTKVLIKNQRAFLKDGLGRLGLEVIGSHANYVFFAYQGVQNLSAALEKKGILVRSCANYHSLDSRFYRIAVRTEEENTLLLEALKPILQGEG